MEENKTYLLEQEYKTLMHVICFQDEQYYLLKKN